MVGSLTSYKMSRKEFDALRALVGKHTGISLSPAKEELVKRRFSPRLRSLGLDNFSEYISFFESNQKDELVHFSNAITTNLTSFFREKHHFEYLEKTVIPLWIKNAAKTRQLRIWSAGCSTGQEAYSLAMVLRETISDIKSWDIKILATDLDKQCLAKGKAGVYQMSDLETTPKAIAQKWFKKAGGSGDTLVEAKPELKSLIHFKHLNLINKWPMSGYFDAIFCRNVFIYFEKPLQDKFIDRFSQLQKSGSFLFIGHSETISESISSYALVGQTIYQRRN